MYFVELYDLSRLTHVVLDEADTLLDDSFSEMTLRILRKLKVSYTVESYIYSRHFNCIIGVFWLEISVFKFTGWELGWHMACKVVCSFMEQVDK